MNTISHRIHQYTSNGGVASGGVNSVKVIVEIIISFYMQVGSGLERVRSHGNSFSMIR
ncbi:MAG: hypothetical protein BWY67_02335 [Bacteroidetes bacterium ADurb.Bin397]|nr:MAG: hypothetical protein BWY67_02335 [Bacteroidetes bacterium ADurb.Bin397]